MFNRISAITMVLLLTASSALGQTRLKTTYQGQLKLNGSPVNGSHSVAFIVYDDPNAGSIRDCFPHCMPCQVPPTPAGCNTSAAFTNGLVTQPVDFDASIFDGTDRWLELWVDGVPLAPRQQITFAPYATFSARPWATSGANILYTGAGNVGIAPRFAAADSPSERLDLGGHADGTTLQVGDYTALGEELSSGATVVGDNVKPGHSPSGGMQFITSHPTVGGRAIEMSLSTGIAFHATAGSATAGAPFANEVMRITNSGSVGIGTGSPSEKLTVAGNIRATGSVFASCGTLSCSDARYKKNIAPLEDGLSLVEKLRPVRYEWKRDEFPEWSFSAEPQVGLIAQEVREIAPEVVHKSSDGYYAIDYSRLTPVVVQAIQEQQKTIHQQQGTIAELNAASTCKNAEIADLTARLARLEAAVSKLANP